jgi:hypothetical protein
MVLKDIANAVFQERNLSQHQFKIELLPDLIPDFVKLPHRLPVRSYSEEVEYAIYAVSGTRNDVESIGLDGLVLFIFIDLGGNFDFIAVLVILHHDEKTYHKGTEKPPNVGQCVVVLFECASDGKGKAGLAYIKLNVLSGVGDDGRRKYISLCWLIDYSSNLLIRAYPGPQTFISVNCIGGDEDIG